MRRDRHTGKKIVKLIKKVLHGMNKEEGVYSTKHQHCEKKGSANVLEALIQVYDDMFMLASLLLK